MTALTTEFIKIGQSGATIDGRTIDATSLKQAAESYSLDTYSAVIWLDHYRFYGSYGRVIELQAREENGVVSLYARIEPNKYLMQLNAEGQCRFCSMELQPNFADTGKYYLTGLAVTDQPASLGTEVLKFSRKGADAQQTLLVGEPTSVGAFTFTSTDEHTGAHTAADPSADERIPEVEPKWFTRLFEKFSGKPANPNFEEEPPMESKEFTALQEQLNELNQKLDSYAAGQGEEAPKKAAEPETPEKTEAAEYAAQLGALTETVNTIAEKFTAMEQRFNAAAPGTTPPENANPAEEAGLV